MTSHFEREILQQVEILSKLSSIELDFEQIKNTKRVVFIASGSSKNASDFGAYFFEQIGKIPAKVEYASEVIGRDSAFFADDLIVFVSQSGESADVLQVLEQVQNIECKTLALVNNMASPIAQKSDMVISMEAGKELAIPASKSFSASYAKLYMLANYFAQKEVDMKKFSKNVKELLDSELCNEVVNELKGAEDIVILGHNLARFSANEIGLKLKETAFLNTISYPLGEFIHGHMAILKNIKMVVAISFSSDKNHKMNLINIEKIKKTYNPKVLLITDDESQKGIHIDFDDENLLPLLAIVLFQQVSLKLTLLKGINPDSPEGLKKVVQ